MTNLNVQDAPEVLQTNLDLRSLPRGQKLRLQNMFSEGHMIAMLAEFQTAQTEHQINGLSEQ